MSTSDGAVLGMTQIFGSAPRNRAFNVVLLAEGFRNTEQAAFNTAAANFVTAFTATVPFNRMSRAINVFRVNVRSTDSGADNPNTGTTVRTYFDSTFGSGGLDRLLTCNNTTALAVAAAQVPEFSVCLVVVNSATYGGAGGSVATFSLAGGAMEIAIHEMGHTAFRLADEYNYWAGGDEPDRAHHPPGEPEEPNVTLNTDRATLKWRWAVAPTTALPTTSNANCAVEDPQGNPFPAATVGCYEGAHYYHCDAYRPQFDCKMRALNIPFCKVCEAVIKGRIAPLLALRARPQVPIHVTARYPDHLDVSAVADDGRTMSTWWDGGSGWGDWFQVSGGLASPGSPVTSVARYSGHLDLFTVGTDNRVYSTWWDVTSGWAGWFRIGSLQTRPGSTVNVVSRYSDHLDLFTVASNGRVMSTWWDARTSWADWFQVSGGVASPGARVTAIARYPFHLDLFTVGTDGRVWSTWWDDRSGWAGWFPIGSMRARPDATVNVVARYPDHLDLFTVANDGRVMSTWWDSRSGWANWFQLAGGVAAPGSPVTAVSRFPDQLDVFTVGTDNRIYSIWWNSHTGWANWFQVSGGRAPNGAGVTPISRVRDHLDLFTVGLDGRVWSTWWDGATGWGSWFLLTVS
jgi:hypothetical protein